MATILNKIFSTYWENLYNLNQTGWDVGYATQPITEYIDQLEDKSLSILIPGAGNGYEAEYLYGKKFSNVLLLDFVVKALENFSERVSDFPGNNLIHEDFFNHYGKYDLIFEQTFFCSLLKSSRETYVRKMHDLLKPGGKLVGLLFNHEFGTDYQPFGGTEDEYRWLFKEKFLIKRMEVAYNSIKPRKGRELFFILEKLLKSLCII